MHRPLGSQAGRESRAPDGVSRRQLERPGARFVEAVKWLRMAGGYPASEKMTALKMCWDVDY